MKLVLKYMSAIWLVLSLGVFGLLTTPRYTYSEHPGGFVARTYGWPGGWLTCNRYKSGKTNPPGQYRLDTYVSDRSSYMAAWGVAVVAPGFILLPLWRHYRKLNDAS